MYRFTLLVAALFLATPALAGYRATWHVDLRDFEAPPATPFVINEDFVTGAHDGGACDASASIHPAGQTLETATMELMTVSGGTESVHLTLHVRGASDVGGGQDGPFFILNQNVPVHEEIQIVFNTGFAYATPSYAHTYEMWLRLDRLEACSSYEECCARR